MKLNKRYKRSIRQDLPFYISASALTMFALLMFYLFYMAGVGIAAYGDEFFDRNKLEDASLSTYIEIPDKEIGKIEDKYSLTMEKERYATVDEDGEDYKTRVFVRNKKIDKCEIIRGEDIKSDDEVLISAGYAKAQGIDPGDRIKIDGRKYTVSGMFLRPDYLYMLENLTDDYKNISTFFLTYMTKDEFGRRFDGAKAEYKVIYGKDTDTKAFRKYVNKHYFVSNYIAAEENTRISFVYDQAKMFLLMSWVMLVVLPFITVALISILIGRKVRSEQKIIGTLSAMGYERSKLMKHYSLFAVIPGVLGGVLTTVATKVLAQPFGELCLADYEPMQAKFSLPIWIALVGIAVPSLIYWISAMLRVRKLLRRDTVDLLAGRAGKENRAGKLMVKSKAKVRTKYKIRTLAGNPGRSSVVFLGIFLGAMIVSFAFSFIDSVNAVGDQAHGEFGSFKYEYILSELREGAPKHGEAVSVMTFEDKDQQRVQLMGLDKDAELWNLKTLDGKRADIENGWYVSTLCAEIFGLEKGDEFTFRDIATLEKHKVKIDGIIKNGYQNYLVSSRAKAAKITGLDKRQYNAILSDRKLDLDSSVVAETITDKTYKNLMNNMLDAMGSMIYAMMIIGVLICIAALYVTVNMMISESTHNISMLKVLGYDDRRINDMVINANHLLLIPGIVAGELFAYGLMAWYAKEFVNIEQLIIPATLEPKSAVITAAMVAAGYFISLGLLRRKVAKTDMIEALKDGRE